MNKQVIEKALSLVGQGYIYGAKGQKCSFAFRQQQAAQYPEQAENILGIGAKWDGIPVWDCAQLTRACANAGDISMVSGATSQWNKTHWASKGTIASLPEDKTVFLFRRQSGSDSVMQHTGVALGDGTCIHARGTADGVVRQQIEEYPWTHWAVPDWPEKKEGELMQNIAIVKAPSGTVNMRTGATRSASLVDRLPIGTQVEVVAEMIGNDGEMWMEIRHNGRTGYMMSQYLQREPLPETPQNNEQESGWEKREVEISMPREMAESLLDMLRKAVEA